MIPGSMLGGLVGGLTKTAGEGATKISEDRRKLSGQKELTDLHFQNQKSLASMGNDNDMKRQADLLGMQMLMNIAKQEHPEGYEGVMNPILMRAVENLGSGQPVDWEGSMDEYTKGTTRPASPTSPAGQRYAGNVKAGQDAAIENVAPPLRQASEMLSEFGDRIPMSNAIQEITEKLAEGSNAIKERKVKFNNEPPPTVSGRMTQYEQQAMVDQQLTRQMEAQWKFGKQKLDEINRTDPTKNTYASLITAGNSPAQALLTLSMIDSMPQMLAQVSKDPMTGTMNPLELTSAFNKAMRDDGTIAFDPGGGTEVARQNGRFIVATGEMKGVSMFASALGMTHPRTGAALTTSFFSEGTNTETDDPFTLEKNPPMAGHDFTGAAGKGTEASRKFATNSLFAMDGLHEAKRLLDNNPALQPDSFGGWKAMWQDFQRKWDPGDIKDLSNNNGLIDGVDIMSPEGRQKVKDNMAALGKRALAQESYLVNDVSRNSTAEGKASIDEIRAYFRITKQIREQLARAATGAQAGYAELKHLYDIVLKLHSPNPRKEVDLSIGVIGQMLRSSGISYLTKQQRIQKYEDQRTLAKQVMDATQGSDLGSVYNQSQLLQDYWVGGPPPGQGGGQGGGVDMMQIFNQLLGGLGGAGVGKKEPKPVSVDDLYETWEP